MRLKQMTITAALVSAAIPAFAGISPGVNGNAELFLSVFDDVNKVSYTKDLGVSQNSILNAGSTSLSFGINSTAWNSFVAASDPANLKWAVVSVGGGKVLTTANNSAENTAKVSETTNNDVGFAQATTSSRFLRAVNATGTHATPGAPGSPNNFGVNGESVNFASDSAGGYFGAFGPGLQPTGKGEFLGDQLPFSNANRVGEASNFYALSTSGTPVTALDALVSFSTGGGSATLTLGTGSSLVTAVPEPSTYAMLMGGLIAVGVVARRRQR